MNLTFSNQQNGNGGFIDLHYESEELGKLTYTIFPEENKLIISFVMVYPKFEGQGFGKKLVEEAIAFARKNNWVIYPHCSYARSVMRRMSDIEDVFPG